MRLHFTQSPKNWAGPKHLGTQLATFWANRQTTLTLMTMNITGNLTTSFCSLSQAMSSQDLLMPLGWGPRVPQELMRTSTALLEREIRLLEDLWAGWDSWILTFLPKVPPSSGGKTERLATAQGTPVVAGKIQSSPVMTLAKATMIFMPWPPQCNARRKNCKNPNWKGKIYDDESRIMIWKLSKMNCSLLPCRSGHGESKKCQEQNKFSPSCLFLKAFQTNKTFRQRNEIIYCRQLKCCKY